MLAKQPEWEMGLMQQRRPGRKVKGETGVHRISLDRTEADVIDLKMHEAIERIERLRSKTMLAVGAMLETYR